MFLTANIFQPLIDVFQAVLVFIHDNLSVSWGFSIVLLTVLIRVALVPLAVKQFHSMQRLQAHMPELKALQEKYKDDKQRQQQEVMRFYQENKVNPFASCLPMVAQLPVLLSLYYMLRNSLRHDICPNLNPLHAAHTVACGSTGKAGFLFIHDLTSSASGATLIVLMLLYVGSQLLSSLLMASPTMDKNQRLMMLFMPLLFVIFVFRFPTGLLVYWITGNVLIVMQQYTIKRLAGPPPAVASSSAAGAVPGGRGSGRGGADGGSKPVRTVSPRPGGGLAGLLRGEKDDAKAGNGKAGGGDGGKVVPLNRDARAVPPPSPRKKKKRSGRRR